MRVREATEQDAKFLAWVTLSAERSHVERSMTEYMIDRPEEIALQLLERQAVSGPSHWRHYSTFLIAEIDDEPIAGLSGYDPELQAWNTPVALSAWFEAAQSVGITNEEMPQVAQRSSVIQAVTPDDEPGTWVIENVATVPTHRRQGAIDALIEAILDRGRSRGFTLAQVGVMIGNEPARNAYIKQGFRVKDEKRNPEFEAAIGSPGMERLLRSI